MKINLGSTNKNKIAALKETLAEYERFKNAEIRGLSVKSEVADQPITLEETVRGAINRAKNAYQDCDFSVGMESGLIPVPYSKSGYMDLTVCAIYDGKEIHLGISPAWEFAEKRIMQAVVNEGLDLSQAGNKFGITNNPDIGNAEGVVGVATRGHMTRLKYTGPAIHMALLHIDHDQNGK